jgi:signal transduction histidine kinase
VLTCVEGILRDLSPGATGELEAGRIHESATIAREQILRCRGITQHFLRMSRGQRSHSDLVEVESCVSAVARLIEPTARDHSVRIELGKIPPALHVRAGEADLQQALLNLLLNAIQASKPGGRVAVEVESGDHVRLRVIDDGCGIPVEARKRIFEPFFSARQGGTGLGLFLSLNFVRRWGGEIRVDSELEKGSCFEIILPVAASAAGDLLHEREGEHSARG